MNVFKLLSSGAKFKKKKEKHTILEEDNSSDDGNSKDEAIGGDEVEEMDMDSLREKHAIDVEGEDIPDLMVSFSSLFAKYPDIPPIVKERLTQFGYDIPTAVQMQAIPLLMESREIICSAPTGSGKTLAFLLPLISHLKSPSKSGFRALILAPTRELAKQIHRHFLLIAEGTGLRIHIMRDIKTAAKMFGQESTAGKDIIITTPKRMVTLLQSDPPGIDLHHLEWLVIDECDRLFEDGLKEQLAFIYSSCNQSRKIRRAMFSATFDDSLAEWFKLNLDNTVTLMVGGKNRSSSFVQQKLLFVGNDEGKKVAMTNLMAKGVDAPCLIFVHKISRAKGIFSHLIKSGVNCDTIHSDRIEPERIKVLNEFRTGKVMFLVATELMGRGMDLKAVRTVINYDCPKTEASYIHRVGRAGRGGRTGSAITFFTEKDMRNLMPVVEVMLRSGCDVPDFLRKMHEKEEEKRKEKGDEVEKKKMVKLLMKKRSSKQVYSSRKGFTKRSHKKVAADKK